MNRLDGETCARTLAVNNHKPTALLREMHSADPDKDAWYTLVARSDAGVTMSRPHHRLVWWYMPDGTRVSGR